MIQVKDDGDLENLRMHSENKAHSICSSIGYGVKEREVSRKTPRFLD